MKTTVSRPPRALLVAAMSTSALVGGMASAGAAEACEPGSVDCDVDGTPATLTSESLMEVFTDKVTVIRERSRTVTASEPMAAEPAAAVPEADPVEIAEPVESVESVEMLEAIEAVEAACGGVHPMILGALQKVADNNAAFRAEQASILRTLDMLSPKYPCAPDAAVTGTDLETVVGPAVEADPPPDVLAEVPAEVPAEMPVGTPAELPADAATAVTETAGETIEAETTETATMAEEVGPVAVKGGVIVEDVVAPEQTEVVGPRTVSGGELPQTGGNGSALAVLGLAMVASGAAARYVARD